MDAPLPLRGLRPLEPEESKTSACSRAVELQRLRRELLRRIVENEARRHAVQVRAQVMSDE